MIRAIRQEEALPASYPAVEGVPAGALAATWQRIEHYTAHRFAPRQVVWRLDTDAGEWHPPLGPVVLISAQQPGGDPFTPEAGPMGGYMLPEGHVTVTATVGAGPVPGAVSEAVRRLNIYLAVSDGMMVDGMLNIPRSTDERPPLEWRDVPAGMALIKSGAADLLRAYRRV